MKAIAIYVMIVIAVFVSLNLIPRPDLTQIMVWFVWLVVGEFSGLMLAKTAVARET